MQWKYIHVIPIGSRMFLFPEEYELVRFVVKLVISTDVS